MAIQRDDGGVGDGTEGVEDAVGAVPLVDVDVVVGLARRLGPARWGRSARGCTPCPRMSVAVSPPVVVVSGGSVALAAVRVCEVWVGQTRN